MHDTSTVFPENIDSRRVFSDVQLKHAEIHKEYNALIKAKDYQGASEHLYASVEEANVDMDYNGSYLWNRIDNAIEAIEEYVVTLPDTNARAHYSQTEPPVKQENMAWIY